jgi:hypothetical protein
MAQRTPWAPCDGNRGINKELKPILRAQISMGKAVGLTHEQIGALTFFNASDCFHHPSTKSTPKRF